MITIAQIQQAQDEFKGEYFKQFAWKRFSDGKLEYFESENEFVEFYKETLGDCIVLKSAIDKAKNIE